MQQILDKYWDGVLPVNPIAIARNMGIKVFFTDFEDATIAEQVMRDGMPVILIARGTTGTRLGWAIAHSIGHFVLGHVSGAEKLVASWTSK